MDRIDRPLHDRLPDVGANQGLSSRAASRPRCRLAVVAIGSGLGGAWPHPRRRAAGASLHSLYHRLSGDRALDLVARERP